MARVVQLGESRCEYPSRELQSLSSNHTKLFRCGDWEGLRAALERDGYLYIQELLPRESVLSAGSAVLRHLGELENVLDPASPISSGTLQAEPVLPFLEGKTALTECSAVASVISGTHLRSFFEGLLGEAPLTFEYKWLRSVGRKGFTGAHCDRVYMSRGSTRLHTSWVPFQDTPVELGGLAVCEGSHRLPGFAKLQETYGALDVERDGLVGTGWFSSNPAEISAMDPSAQWRTADFRAGDCVIFGMGLIHCSTANLTNQVRISCDVRWQPATDPVDVRYMNPSEARVKTGAWVPDSADIAVGGSRSEAQVKVTIESLKRKWGFST